MTKCLQRRWRRQAKHHFENGEWGMQNAEWRLQNGEWRMGNAEFGNVMLE